MRRAWLVAGGIGLTFAIVGAVDAQEEAEPRSMAPYQIVASTPTQVRVDIGRDRSRANALRLATVLTRSEAVPATLVRTRRICETLCGEDDGKECHYEAVLRPSRAVTEPIAVLAGRPLVSSMTALSSGPEQPIGSESGWLDAAPLTSDGGVYRWTRFDDGVFLTFDGNREFFAPAVTLASCTQQSVDVFTRLSCLDGQVQLLYEGARPIVQSFAEYGDAAVDPLFRFRLGDKDAFLIRLGLKAHMVVALLVKEDGEWRLDVRAADYALLC